MFKCRACSGTPFAAFFGFSDNSDKDKEVEEKDTSETDDGASSLPNVDDLPNPDPEQMDEPRNAEEVGYLAKTWDTYVHERVKHLWKSPKTRKDVLKNIARGCSKKDDPVLGNDIACVRWIGQFEDDYPVIYMTRPGETTESSTYVSRMLVFLFADQESYEKIDADKYTAFPMGCGNKWCINLTHIVLN